MICQANRGQFELVGPARKGTILGQAESRDFIGVSEQAWPAEVGIQDLCVAYNFPLIPLTVEEGPVRISKIILYLGSDDGRKRKYS